MLTRANTFVPSLWCVRLEGTTTQNPPPPLPPPSEEVTKLRAALEETRERFTRALADCDNSRKAAERAAAEAKEQGHVKMARDMLGVADNLDRALVASKAGHSPDQDGLRSIANDLAERLSRHGVARMSCAKGTRFDPNFHSAVFEVARNAVDGAPLTIPSPPAEGQSPSPSSSATDPNAIVVADELLAGYTMKGKLLRAAQVAVYARK